MGNYLHLKLSRGMNAQPFRKSIVIFNHSKVLSNDVSSIFDKNKMSFLRNFSNLQTSVIMKVMKMGKEGKVESGKSGRKRVVGSHAWLTQTKWNLPVVERNTGLGVARKCKVGVLIRNGNSGLLNFSKR